MAPLNIKVVTTYNNKLFNEYAYRFKETYNWPFDLFVYSEDIKKINKRCEIVNIFDTSLVPSIENTASPLLSITSAIEISIV